MYYYFMVNDFVFGFVLLYILNNNFLIKIENFGG